MTHLIIVEARGEGWAIRSDRLAADMTFRSGAAAEQAARNLAERLARAGRRVEVHIRMRNGALAGRFVRVAQASEAEPA